MLSQGHSLYKGGGGASLALHHRADQAGPAPMVPHKANDILKQNRQTSIQAFSGIVRNALCARHPESLVPCSHHIQSCIWKMISVLNNECPPQHCEQSHVQICAHQSLAHSWCHGDITNQMITTSNQRERREVSRLELRQPGDRSQGQVCYMKASRKNQPQRPVSPQMGEAQ